MIDNKAPNLRMARPKLVAIDLDGTLVRSDQTVSARTVRTLIRLQQTGVKVAIASGRPTYGTMPVAETLHLKDHGGYVMSYNGGELYECATDRQLFASLMEESVKPIICSCAKEHGLPVMTYIGSEVVTEDGENEYIRYSSMRNRMKTRVVDDFLSAASCPITKCIIVGNPERLVAVEKEMREKLGGKADAYRSEPFFLEIVPQGIDKAKGLEKLLNIIKVKREECMAFGDGYNDMSMIEYAGTGVAMGNAQEEVKRIATMVTSSNNEDGVAEVIERMFF
ncbi:MAG: Cof-type HAD-IIB family hydrolase [Bacteroidaceae bacterium]|nr:Cof-type HAD-IIB family hydrolase [Bacteroidaceae bacterium]